MVRVENAIGGKASVSVSLLVNCEGQARPRLLTAMRLPRSKPSVEEGLPVGDTTAGRANNVGIKLRSIESENTHSQARRSGA